MTGTFSNIVISLVVFIALYCVIYTARAGLIAIGVFQ